MSDSLIPERPLVVSPSLAATIGLEQALLLQHLEQCIELNPVESAELQQQYRWSQCSIEQLARQLPFWSPAAISRILQDLNQLGMLVISNFPREAQQAFHFAINQRHSAPASTSAATTHNKQPLGAQRIPQDWQPGDAVLAKLQELGIDADFIQSAIADFVLYWRERNEVSHAWSSKFLQYVSRSWEQEQQRRSRQVKNSAQPERRDIDRQWQPSQDAIEILEQMGIHHNFIADAIPEFVLYWRERGAETKTWNSKFVSHVKRQWASYTHALKHDTQPRPIPENWQPDSEVYDVLALANIDAAFAKSLVAEFVMYWRERNELYHSWNTRFLQHVKRQWSRNHLTAGSSGISQPASTRKTRERSLTEDLTDRSWAG